MLRQTSLSSRGTPSPSPSQRNSLKPIPKNLSPHTRRLQAFDSYLKRGVKTKKEAAEGADLRVSTFRHWTLGRPSKEEDAVQKQRLTPKEEEHVIWQCEVMQKCGFPQPSRNIHGIALSLGKKREGSAFELSKRWVDQSFLKRHKELKMRLSSQLDAVRVRAGNNWEAIAKFFEDLLELVTLFGIDLRDTYDVDETGFLMGHVSSERVADILRDVRRNGELFPADLIEELVPPGTQKQEGSRSFATLIECICADGSKLGPALIYKAMGNRPKEEWWENLNEMPDDFRWGQSPNGWTNRQIAMEWLEWHFGPGSSTERKANGRWRLLLFDGHNSHLHDDFLLYCLDHKILPVCLPPHTSHFLQPLDVSVFSPYKHAYTRILQERYRAGLPLVTKSSFWQLILQAREEAFTEANIRSGFWHTGLAPVDIRMGKQAHNKILGLPPDHELPERPIDEAFMTCVEVSSDPIPKRPNTPPFQKIDLDELRNWKTPRTTSEIAKYRHAAHAEDINSHDPRQARLLHIVDKALACAEEKTLLVDCLQERLSLHKKKESELLQQVQKPRKRRKLVPDDGLVLRSRDDFARWKKSLRNHEKELKELRCQKDRLSKKLSTLRSYAENRTSMLDKHAQFTEARKPLPRTWHPTDSVQKELLDVQAKINESEEKLQQLETEERVLIADTEKSDTDAEAGEDGMESQDNAEMRTVDFEKAEDSPLPAL